MTGHCNRFRASVKQDCFEAATVIAIDNPTQELESVPMGKPGLLLEQEPRATGELAGDASIHCTTCTKAKVDIHGRKEAIGCIARKLLGKEGGEATLD